MRVVFPKELAEGISFFLSDGEDFYNDLEYKYQQNKNTVVTIQSNQSVKINFEIGEK